eukprot:scaffold420316_cov15-Prasinocladus_malaysianus.AAC.1
MASPGASLSSFKTEATGFRSPYLSHAKRALYQLSYDPIRQKLQNTYYWPSFSLKKNPTTVGSGQTLATLPVLSFGE